MSLLKVNAIQNIAGEERFGPVLMTQVTASGTSVDFTGIPSWAKRVTVMFNGVSTSGASIPMIQLGSSSGVETTGYSGQGDSFTGSGAAINVVTSTANSIGFNLSSSITPSSTSTLFGLATLVKFSGNTWVLGSYNSQILAGTGAGTGSKNLSGTLDRIRITTVNGTDTFDAGTINLMLEG